MLNINSPILNAQLMTDNPLSTVGIVAMVFVVLSMAYIAVIAYKAEIAERNTVQLNAMNENAELDIISMNELNETDLSTMPSPLERAKYDGLF